MSVFAKIIWAIGAVLCIATGIAAFCMPSQTLVGISIFLGIMLILMGISYIISYATERKSMLGAGWILVIGICTIIIGIFVLCNDALVSAVLPVILSIWILLIGIIRAMSSFDLKRLGFTKWWISLVIGLLLIALSILSLFKPIVSVIMITVFVGLYLTINGIYSLVELYYINKLENVAKDYLNKVHSIVVEPIDVKKED